MSRAKNPKYESMSLEELKANMEKSRQELEAAIHNKNLLEQRKKLVERRERSHRLIVKGAEFEKAFPLSRDLEQEEFQEIMNQMRNSSYNKSVVRQNYIAASQKDRLNLICSKDLAFKAEKTLISLRILTCVNVVKMVCYMLQTERMRIFQLR